MKITIDTKKNTILLEDPSINILELVAVLKNLNEKIDNNISSTLGENFCFNYLNVDCLGEITTDCMCDGNCDG